MKLSSEMQLAKVKRMRGMVVSPNSKRPRMKEDLKTQEPLRNEKAVVSDSASIKLSRDLSILPDEPMGGWLGGSHYVKVVRQADHRSEGLDFSTHFMIIRFEKTILTILESNFS